MLCPPEVLLRVLQLRDLGISFRRIAAMLNAEGTPTPAGLGPWSHSHVYRLTGTAGAMRLRRLMHRTMNALQASADYRKTPDRTAHVEKRRQGFEAALVHSRNMAYGGVITVRDRGRSGAPPSRDRVGTTDTEPPERPGSVQGLAHLPAGVQCSAVSRDQWTRQGGRAGQ